LKKKNDKNNKNNQNKKQVIDLTSYLSPDIVDCDVDGSYTGVPADMYYNDELEQPVQDADDL
jgi:hypothetical protein